MPFVEARDHRGHEESNRGPAQRPARRPGQSQGIAPRAKQKKTQSKVTYKMAAFSDVVMHYLEAREIQSHEKVK